VVEAVPAMVASSASEPVIDHPAAGHREPA
jgi:hypothetical protein